MEEEGRRKSRHHPPHYRTGGGGRVSLYLSCSSVSALSRCTHLAPSRFPPCHMHFWFRCGTISAVKKVFRKKLFYLKNGRFCTSSILVKKIQFLASATMSYFCTFRIETRQFPASAFSVIYKTKRMWGPVIQTIKTSRYVLPPFSWTEGIASYLRFLLVLVRKVSLAKMWGKSAFVLKFCGTKNISGNGRGDKGRWTKGFSFPLISEFLGAKNRFLSLPCIARFRKSRAHSCFPHLSIAD